MKTFHNSINVSGELLTSYETTAQKENKIILEIFKKRPGEWLTPWDVRDILIAETGKDHLIGNVRRALTTWSDPKINALIKSETACAPGKYSKPNHVWTLAA